MAPRETKKAEEKAARKPARGTAAKAKKAATKPRATKKRAAALEPEHVATRAYFLWESGAEGDPAAHWLQAERELLSA